MKIFERSAVNRTFEIKFIVGFMAAVLLVGTVAPSYSLPSNVPSNIIDNAEIKLPAIPFTSEKKGPSFLPNQIIVGFKQGLSNNSIEDFYNTYGNYGLEEKKSLSHGNDQVPNTKLVKTSTPVNSKIIETLQSDPRVDFVEPDYIITINTNDTYYNLLWGLENTGQDIRGSTGTSDSDIDAPEAWGKLGTTSTVLVGIIDTGVDYDHEDLAEHMWTNPGEISGNGIDDDGNGYVDDIHGWNAYRNNGNPDDDNGHGSHTAGTIGAVGNNAKGIVGISQDVEIIACKFLSRSGSGSTSDAIECFNYFNSISGVRVTNNSWGGGGYSQGLYNAMNNPSILHVVAAGNDGVNIDNSPHYPASYLLDNIISVAATDFNDNYASFSNYGTTTVDIAAPGVDIASTYKNNGYVWMSGTSMAAPHVTGAVALTLSANPTQTSTDVKNLILANGDPLSGIKTLTDKRLNVDSILSEISSPVSPPSPDATLPETSIDSAIDGSEASVTNDGTTSSNSITFAFSGTDNIGVESLECSLDSASFLVCSSPKGFDSLSDGVHNFKVRSIDTSNNIDTTPASFNWTVATPPPDTTSPAISLIVATHSSNSAIITWTTDEPATSTVDYGSNNTYGTSVSDSSLVTSHSIELTGLSSSTTYHFSVSSTDDSTNTASSADDTFATSEAPVDIDMTVDNITHDLQMKGKGGKGKLSFTVSITEVADPQIAVSGANVSVTLFVSGAFADTTSGLTNSNGQIDFIINSISSGNSYKLQVDDVIKTGFVYDSPTTPSSHTVAP